MFTETDLQPDKDRSLLDRPGHTHAHTHLHIRSQKIVLWRQRCPSTILQRADSREANAPQLWGHCFGRNHLIKCYETGGGKKETEKGKTWGSRPPRSTDHCVQPSRAEERIWSSPKKVKSTLQILREEVVDLFLHCLLFWEFNLIVIDVKHLNFIAIVHRNKAK